MSILCECYQTGTVLWTGEGCLRVVFPCRVFSVFLAPLSVAMETPHYNSLQTSLTSVTEMMRNPAIHSLVARGNIHSLQKSNAKKLDFFLT